MNKIKVFFIINSFSMGGGAESLLTTIVNNLDENEYDIGIMEIIHSDKKIEPIKPHIKMYKYYTEADAADRKSRMYYVYHEWDKVIDEYIPQDYDVYISFNYLKPTFLLPKGKNNIAWIHGDVYDLLSSSLQEERELQNESFKKANKIICVSKKTAESVYELFPEHREKISIIFNGLDIKKVNEKAVKPEKLELANKSILCIGRIEDNKNPLRVLEVFKKVNMMDSEIHLYYIGYGNLIDAVKEKAKEYGVENNVHLLGYYQNPFSVIKQCSAVCMMSKSEGFPMSLLESVALEKPFVSTPVGGAVTLSNNNTCGLVTDDNDEAARKLVEMVNNSETYREACRESIKNFELSHYIDQIDKLIKSFIK